jgi:hypothetical protein
MRLMSFRVLVGEGARFGHESGQAASSLLSSRYASMKDDTSSMAESQWLQVVVQC